MLGIAIESYTHCPKCSKRVHLNGLFERFTCRACQAQVKVPVEHWQGNLYKTFDEAPGWRELQGRRGRHLVSKKREYVTARVRQDPHFRDSRTPIDMQLAQAAAERGFLVNPVTGRPAMVRRVPAAFQAIWPEVTLVVEEEEDLLLAAGVGPAGLAPARTGKRLEVGCSGCGAALPLVQGRRLVSCSYCEAVSFLEDELYRRLNPDSRPHRFYLWTTLEPLPLPLPVAPAEKRPMPYEDELLLPAASPLPDRRGSKWISVQLTRSCDHCAEPLPLPALLPELACAQCGEVNELKPDFWGLTLTGLAEMGYSQPPGETVDFTGFGRYQVLLCQEAPTIPGEAGPLEIERLPEVAARSGAPGQLTVRRVPPDLADYLPGIEFLAGEPEELLAAAKSGAAWRAAAAGRPQSFTCPACGGNLTVDGAERVVVCSYCDAPAGLPDELWVRLHPARAARKWFFTFDPRTRVFSWMDETYDATVDAAGNLYLLCERDGYKGLWVVALDTSLRPRWLIQHPFGDDARGYRGQRVAATPAGELLLWDESGDGSPIRRLGCSDGRPLDRAALELGRVIRLALDTDGSYLAFVQDVDDEHTRVLRRFDPDGRPRRPWDSNKRSGRVRALLRRLAGGHTLPYLREAGHRPEKIRADIHLLVACAGEAGVFMHDGELLYGFARDGKRRFRVEATLRPVNHGLIGTPDGQLYLLTDRPRGLCRVSTADGSVTPFIAPGSEGGAWGKENLAAIAPDGTVYALGGEGRLRIFAPDGQLRFANWCVRAHDMQTAS